MDRNIKIGICGAVSSGKSTLINAIFGDIVSGTGIGRTTIDVKHMNYTRAHIQVPESVKVTIIDTPGSSDVELGEIRNESFLALRSCHIIIHVIDLLDYAKPTSDLTAKVNDVINRVIRSSSIGKNIIRVVNKGDHKSEEYTQIFQKLQREFRNVVQIHASAACIRNFTGDIDKHKKELKNIINSFAQPKISSANMLTQTVIQQIVQDYSVSGNDLTGFDELVSIINRFIAGRCHQMLIDSLKCQPTHTLTQKMDQYLEIKQICTDLNKPYLDSYADHLNYDENCCRLL